MALAVTIHMYKTCTTYTHLKQALVCTHNAHTPFYLFMLFTTCFHISYVVGICTSELSFQGGTLSYLSKLNVLLNSDI